MNDRVNRVFCKNCLDRFKVRQVAVFERNLLPHNGFNSTHCFSGGIVKIVEDYNIVSRLDDLNRLGHVRGTSSCEEGGGGGSTVWEPI